jgi:hypothetical protein
MELQRALPLVGEFELRIHVSWQIFVLASESYCLHVSNKSTMTVQVHTRHTASAGHLE